MFLTICASPLANLTGFLYLCSSKIDIHAEMRLAEGPLKAVLEEPEIDRREMLEGTKENGILPDGGSLICPTSK